MSTSRHSNGLLGWTPIEAASRSLQAVQGLVCFVPSEARDTILPKVTQETIDWLERIAQNTDAENIAIVEQNRAAFEELITNAKFPFFSASAEQLWCLFMERYDMTTFQLRANAADILACFDLRYIGDIFRQPPSYFRRLPPSSELVIGPWNAGLRADLVIPPRLLTLDTILMLHHTRREHNRMEQSVTRLSDGSFQSRSSGRLDSYARQTLILAASVCDNVLTEYGFTVISALEVQSAPSDVLERLEALQNKGLTARLREAPAAWSVALGGPTRTLPNFVRDMLILIEIRNRLVHPDGRLNCWFAFQLDPLRARNWQFSERLQPYLDKQVLYREINSNVGYELSLAEFCVDTMLMTIDYIHNIVYPREANAPWLNLCRMSTGELDFNATLTKEQLLQIEQD